MKNPARRAVIDAITKARRAKDVEGSIIAA